MEADTERDREAGRQSPSLSGAILAQASKHHKLHGQYYY